jgi:hypothetical protein
LVVISALLPIFRKDVCPNCIVYSHIRGQKGLVGYVMKDPESGTFYYLTYVRGHFRLEGKQGIDKSVLIEAKNRFKAFIVKAHHEDEAHRIIKFLGYDAKLWYNWVISNNSWYQPPDEKELLGNIPVYLLEDMKRKGLD